MKRSFRRALARLSLILLGLVTFVILALATFVYWVTVHPDDAYRLAQRYLLPADLKISWSAVHFTPKRITWLHWSVEWTIEELHVFKGTPRIDLPIQEFGLVFEASVWQPRTFANFSRVTVRAPKRVLFEPSDEPSTGPEPTKNPFEMIKSYVNYLALGSKYATIEGIDVAFDDVRILRPGGDDLKLSASIKKPVADREPRVVAFDVHAKTRAFDAVAGGEADAGKLDSKEPFFSAAITYDGSGVKQAGTVSLTYGDDVLHGGYRGDVAYHAAGAADVMKFKPDLRLVIDSGHADVTLATPISGLPSPLKKVDAVDAHLVVPLEGGRMWARAASTLTVSAPIDLFFVDQRTRQSLEGPCACKVPERLRVDLKGQIWIDTWLGHSTVRRPIADLRLDAEGVRNKLFDLNLAVDLKIARENGTYLFEPHLDSDAHLHSYRGLRNILDARNVMIPAPFDVLDGTIDVSAHGPINREEKLTRTPVEIKVALASANQKIDLSSTVVLELASTLKSLDVYIKLLINDFTAQLPPVEPLAGLPPVTGDQRVILTPPKPAAPAPPKKAGGGFKVQVFFSAKTARAGAIKLLSQLAKPNVPITVNVDRASNGDLTGHVQLEPFGISYLRRTVFVEQMRVLMDERDPANFPVDGRFRIDQTQYKVFVDISGTIKAPSIRLSSEPYLPRADIISVLLYDRVSDKLVSGDAETAGSFESAMADRAIGLFGLWAFASTPIKSFTYNPVTKVYSATVQLADGLTAGIGTNWEEAASFEVRKRVSRRWVLTASWSPSEVTRDQVGKLVLQWEKRF